MTLLRFKLIADGRPLTPRRSGEACMTHAPSCHVRWLLPGPLAGCLCRHVPLGCVSSLAWRQGQWRWAGGQLRGGTRSTARCEAGQACRRSVACHRAPEEPALVFSGPLHQLRDLP